MPSNTSFLCEHFGENVFSFDIMRQRLPHDSYEKLMFAIRNNRSISPEVADVIAHGMKEWAIAKGATHYTHWFQPLTGLTAEKHDSFLEYDEKGTIIDKFSGRMLIMSEPDASNFPLSGIRSTFEARGYAAWDPSSPAFLMKRGQNATLCLPSVYISYTGDVLDKKTPLLRSIRAVSKSAVRMLRLLGNKRVTGATPYVGPEQEYFLVDASTAQRRPDIREVGATLLGAGPSRGQQLEDHYFRAIQSRVLDFMEEVETELVKLGVPVKTRHNEVAPGQFELAVLHAPANVAVDQNQLVMEILKRTAPKHNFEALLHEKPYSHLNGSGKHVNWSLIDSEGTNLFSPGTNKSSRIRFLIFLMAVVSGVKRHGNLLHAIAAGPGNELRLGGREAPLAIQSVFLGNALNDLINNLASVANDTPIPSEFDPGLAGIAKIPKGNIDRNRTSPIAFTGQKFEFRSIGSSVAISLVNGVINAMVAESLDNMSNKLEKALTQTDDRNTAALEVLGDVIKKTKNICFAGDAEQWVQKVKETGLTFPESAPEALDAMLLPTTFKLFAKYNLMNETETRTRYAVKLEYYRKTILVELKVLLQMLTTGVLPAAYRHQQSLSQSINETVNVLGNKTDGLKEQTAQLRHFTGLIGKLIAGIEILKQDEAKLEQIDDPRESSGLCSLVIRPDMQHARAVADELEKVIDHGQWPFAHYDELLIL